MPAADANDDRGGDALGLFGHHPDVSIDFCCEVDALTGYAYDVRVGANFSADWRATSQWDLWGRLSRALRFVRERGDQLDEQAWAAIPLLRSLERYARHDDDMPVSALPALAFVPTRQEASHVDR